jgi:uncharacterized phiE125 gp8 family phage protein
MKATIYTAPTIEPISLAELKTHLRLDSETFADSGELLAIDVGLDGANLTDLIIDGRAAVEAITRRALLTQTWDYYLQDWPTGNFITLPFGNLQNGVGTAPVVSWKDSDGTETTLTVTTDYLVETNGNQCGRIVLPFSVSWPSGELYPSNPIKIRFVCGWTTAALVPKNIKRAVKLASENAYYHGDRHEILKPAINNLLASWRLWEEF